MESEHRLLLVINVNIVRARFILDQKNGEKVLNSIASLFSPVTVKLRGYPVKERSYKSDHIQPAPQSANSKALLHPLTSAKRGVE